MTLSQDKFCASCATPLERREVFGTERPACPQCGRVVFYDPKVAAVCVIARDGKILMIRRGTDTGYGLWSLPGGFVDRGEVVETAAAREAWEETGLEVAVDGLLGLFSLPGDPVIVAAFTARETGGLLAPGTGGAGGCLLPARRTPGTGLQPRHGDTRPVEIHAINVPSPYGVHSPIPSPFGRGLG